jgi:hypothetical protein
MTKSSKLRGVEAQILWNCWRSAMAGNSLNELGRKQRASTGYVEPLLSPAIKVLERLSGGRLPDRIYKIEARRVRMPNNCDVAITPGVPIEVILGSSVTIYGTCRFNPKGRYWLVYRTENDHRPQGRIHFDNGRWSMPCFVGSARGVRNVMVARVSPAVELAFQHYWERAHYLNPIQQQIRQKKQPIDPQTKRPFDLKPRLPLVIKGALDGLTTVHSFDVRVQ